MFAEWVKRLRAHAGMTQEEFARALDISNVTVSRWETGRRVAEKRTARDLARFAKRKDFDEPMPQ